MPPFQVELTSKLYELHRDGSIKETVDFDGETKEVLRKLQALLCTQVIPPAVLKEVRMFLDVNKEMKGNLGLNSILLDAETAIGVLVEGCPQCLVQFARVRSVAIGGSQSLSDDFSGPLLKTKAVETAHYKNAAASNDTLPKSRIQTHFVLLQKDT